MIYTCAKPDAVGQVFGDVFCETPDAYEIEDYIDAGNGEGHGQGQIIPGQVGPVQKLSRHQIKASVGKCGIHAGYLF